MGKNTIEKEIKLTSEEIDAIKLWLEMYYHELMKILYSDKFCSDNQISLKDTNVEQYLTVKKDLDMVSNILKKLKGE